MQPLPAVGVLASKKTKGVNSLRDEGEPLAILSFEEAMTSQFVTDAHFIAYMPLEPNGQPPEDDNGELSWPRCNEPVLAHVRSVGGDIVSTMLVFDYDNPGKAEWTAESYERFMDAVIALDVPWAKDFTYLYTTLHGARFIYVLTRPVPVDHAAVLHRGIVREFARQGLNLDRACSDWPRLFRLPRVDRDGKRTEKSAFFDVVEQYECRLDPSILVPLAAGVGPATEYGIVQTIDEEQPEVGRALALLEDQNASTGRVTKTAWWFEAKRRLKNRACYPCLYELAPLADEGGRDSAIQRYVGEAISLLYYLPGTSMELIYALFLEPVLQLEADEGTPDWTAALWDKVQRIWAREKAKADAIKDREARYVADAMALTQVVLGGMREWCNAPELHSDDATALNWMSTKMIACVGTQCHVMTREGQYDTIGVPRALLVPRIRELGMEPLMSLETPKADGNGVKSVDSQTLVNRYGTIVAECEGVVGGDIAGYIRNIGEPNAALVTRLFRRKTDLEPAYDADVEQWLMRLGGDKWVDLCEWIGHALALEDGPICALSLSGPQGVGKKMLVQGLAECIDTECVADGKSFGAFQGSLMKTPFLVINEGFRETQGGTMDPADFFRQVVGGDPLTIDRKFKELMTIRNPCRVIFTANNKDVIHLLAGKRDLSPDDREALALRLWHINVEETAQVWFRVRGGLSWTARPGHRWIRGDAGQASDYIVAKHFLWLHAQRSPPRAGSRFLCEGDTADDVMREMLTRTSSAPAVIETLVKMIEVHGVSGAIDGLLVEEGRVWVLSSSIMEFHRRDAGQKTRLSLDVRRISTVLRGLMLAGSDNAVRAVSTHTAAGDEVKSRMGRWYEIDPQTLLGEALDHGYPSKRLEIIAQKAIKGAKLRKVAA